MGKVSSEKSEGNKRHAILVITAMAMLVSGAVALNGSSVEMASASKGVPTLMEQVALEKPNFGAMSAADLKKLFEEFIVEHSKPYAADKV